MKNLFENTNVNNIEVKNRFIKAATWDEMVDDDGHIYNDSDNIMCVGYMQQVVKNLGIVLTNGGGVQN